MKLPTVNAIWVGATLGPLHSVCLRSFVLAGHRVVLHCYSTPDDLPDGVDVADARRLMPEDRIVYYRSSGSAALFSNLFRLMILKAELGLYVDCDVFCLRPVADADYIFGFETDDRLNSAVLKMPANSAMLQEFLSITSDPHFIAPWLPRSQRRWRHLRKAVGLSAGLETYDWGVLGPRAATYFAERAGVLDRAVAVDVFYPVPFERVRLFIDPGLTLEDISTARTLGIHLYHQALRRLVTSPIPPTSPLGRMFERCSVPLPV